MYLAIAERSYDFIEELTAVSVPRPKKKRIKWWLQAGAMGSYPDIVMPFDGLTANFDWFGHPWALTHESLHGFGYADHHDPGMGRFDAAVREKFRQLRWFVADHPEYVPDWERIGVPPFPSEELP